MCSAGALPETCPCPVHREKTLREESPVRLDVPGHHRQTVPDASAVDHRSLRCPVQVTFKDVIRSGDPPHGGTTPTPRGGTRGPPRRPDPCTVDQPGSGVREGVGTRNGCGRRSGVTTIGAPGHRRPRNSPPPEMAGEARGRPRSAPVGRPAGTGSFHAGDTGGASRPVERYPLTVIPGQGSPGVIPHGLHRGVIATGTSLALPAAVRGPGCHSPAGLFRRPSWDASVNGRLDVSGGTGVGSVPLPGTPRPGS